MTVGDYFRNQSDLAEWWRKYSAAQPESVECLGCGVTFSSLALWDMHHCWWEPKTSRYGLDWLGLP